MILENWTCLCSDGKISYFLPINKAQPCGVTVQKWSGREKVLQYLCYHPVFLYPAPCPRLCYISLWSWMNKYKDKMFSLAAFILHVVWLQWGQICFNYILHFSSTHSHQALLSSVSRVYDLHELLSALYSDWTGMNATENLQWSRKTKGFLILLWLNHREAGWFYPPVPPTSVQIQDQKLGHSDLQSCQLTLWSTDRFPKRLSMSWPLKLLYPLHYHSACQSGIQKLCFASFASNLHLREGCHSNTKMNNPEKKKNTNTLLSRQPFLNT